MTASNGQTHAFSGHLFNSVGTVVRVSISHSPEEILLTIVGEAADLFEHALTGLVLESVGGRGVLRTRGSGQRIEHNRIRFFLDDDANLVQRREHVRILTAQRVELHDEDGTELADTYAVNVSGGGMLLGLPRNLELEPDSVVGFVLHLRDDEEPVHGTARVTRINRSEQQLALEFDRISGQDQDRIVRFIFNRQRAAIAMTRGDAV